MRGAGAFLVAPRCAPAGRQAAEPGPPAARSSSPSCYGLIDRERAGSLAEGCAFLAFLSLCVAYALVAALPVVFLEPSAAGSGIPEVITVLNGVKMPTTLRLKTLACKVFGIIFAVASGLPAGYEGPMVAIGA